MLSATGTKGHPSPFILLYQCGNCVVGTPPSRHTPIVHTGEARQHNLSRSLTHVLSSIDIYLYEDERHTTANPGLSVHDQRHSGGLGGKALSKMLTQPPPEVCLLNAGLSPMLDEDAKGSERPTMELFLAYIKRGKAYNYISR
ncbi:Hypothetical predicted protein [Pelobates cultripes]|uniref:Uncharacterized protein n=1 Tax=Pelobates cultripes TaxID=61616 RepID=A0AAD1RFW5_PELCU|nr:Hypothetical predicted protein [Pelobates cultripes]